MIRKSGVVACMAAGVLATSSPASAGSGISWNYLSASVLASGKGRAGDGGSADLGTGYRFDGAIGIGDHAFFRTKIRNHDFDGDDAPIQPDLAVDTQQWGFGGHFPVDAGFAVIAPWASLNYERVGFIGEVVDGAGFDLGVRALHRDFEVGLSYKISSPDGGDADVDYRAWELSIAYNLVASTDVLLTIHGIELDNVDDLDIDDEKIEIERVIGLGIRVRF